MLLVALLRLLSLTDLQTMHRQSLCDSFDSNRALVSWSAASGVSELTVRVEVLTKLPLQAQPRPAQPS